MWWEFWDLPLRGREVRLQWVLKGWHFRRKVCDWTSGYRGSYFGRRAIAREADLEAGGWDPDGLCDTLFQEQMRALTVEDRQVFLVWY